MLGRGAGVAGPRMVGPGRTGGAAGLAAKDTLMVVIGGMDCRAVGLIV